MCGIAGILKYKQLPLTWKGVERMSSALSHRGPDARGIYENDLVALGHTRLSIIDLNECSNQPMEDLAGRYIIVFNGEIYNFKELRAQLKDYPFRTNGDTEVIVAAFEMWGPDCVHRFTGMFAFSIWDNHKKELFLARDRLGVKPLYFYECEFGILFSSEIKSLLASGLIPHCINMDAVSEFLQFQSVGGAQTIISGIRSLEAGTYMTVKQDGTQSKKKYWSPSENASSIRFSSRFEVKTTLKELLLQAVQARMISDVPVAAFLSGGIDSSAIVGLMASCSDQPINTFTVGFDENEFDESTYALQISKKFNTRHNEIRLTGEHFLENLIPALNAMDTPTGDGINSFVVCKAIRSSGVKVAVSGVGGDELFAGYPIFKQYLRLMRFRRMWKSSKPLRSVLAVGASGGGTKADRYRQLLTTESADISAFYPGFRQIISQRMLRNCTFLPSTNETAMTSALKSHRRAVDKLPLLSQVSVAEYYGYTQQTLLKDMDQMSMANSLEVREPFFDHHLIEFVLGVPDSLKFPHYPKKLLVEALGDLLPENIVHRRKQGFVFPWNNWMRKELFAFCDKHVNDINSRSFMKPGVLQSYWKRFLQNDPSIRWLEIWLFIVLEYWLQRNEFE